MRTEGISILAAVAFHAAILVAARAMPALTLSAAEPRRLDTIEVELAPSQPASMAAREPTPTPINPEAPRVPEQEREPDPRVAVRPLPNQGPQPPTTVPPPETSPPAAPTAKGTQFDELPDERRGVLGLPGVPGLGGNAVWTMPGVVEGAGRAPPPAPTVSPKARPVDKDIAGQVMRDMLATRDKEMGIDLPAAGTVRSALVAAVQSADLPGNARGTIQFRVGPSGQILDVRVLGHGSGSSEAWQRAANAAKAQLAGRGLAMAQYTKGAIITVDVSSKVQAPAGSKGGLQGSGVAFDLSNIGAHTSTQVHASFTVAAIR